jgi:hypothetical protein
MKRDGLQFKQMGHAGQRRRGTSRRPSGARRLPGASCRSPNSTHVWSHVRGPARVRLLPLPTRCSRNTQVARPVRLVRAQRCAAPRWPDGPIVRTHSVNARFRNWRRAVRRADTGCQCLESAQPVLTVQRAIAPYFAPLQRMIRPVLLEPASRPYGTGLTIRHAHLCPPRTSAAQAEPSRLLCSIIVAHARGCRFWRRVCRARLSQQHQWRSRVRARADSARWT